LPQQRGSFRGQVGQQLASPGRQNLPDLRGVFPFDLDFNGLDGFL